MSEAVDNAQLLGRSKILPRRPAPSPGPLPSINPFNDLPVELLALIFRLATLLGDTDAAATAISHSRFLGALLLVCRRWRDVAYSTPSLWTVANLSTTRNFRRGLIHRKARCGTLPVHLNLFISSNHFYGFSQVPVQDINPGCQMKSVRVVGNVDTLGRYFKAVRRVGLMQEAQATEELELIVAGRTFNGLYPYLGGPLARAVAEYRQLRSLSLVAFNLMASLDEQGLALVQECTLPLLEELSLKRCDGCALQILRILVTPALVTLAIDCSASAKAIIPWSSILRQSLASLHSVRTLALYQLPSCIDSRTILSATPQITWLALSSQEDRCISEVLPEPHEGPLRQVTHLTVGGSLKVCAEIREVLSSLAVLEVSADSGVAGTFGGPSLQTRLIGADGLDFESILFRMKLLRGVSSSGAPANVAKGQAVRNPSGRFR